jgi:hypothetical protein
MNLQDAIDIAAHACPPASAAKIPVNTILLIVSIVSPSRIAPPHPLENPDLICCRA